MSSKKNHPKAPAGRKAGKPAPHHAFALNAAEAEAAFARIEPELETVIEPERVVTDISRAVMIVMAAVPNLKALRADISSKLRDFPIELIDRLEDYALAAGYAHVTATPATASENRLQRLLEEAQPLRQDLLQAASAHAYFGHVDQARVDEIKAGSGFVDTAMDLISLAQMFRAVWDKIAHRTPLTREQVDRAGELGAELVRVLSQNSAASTELAERRVRAYTLLVRKYDECRRAVSYVHWHEDDVDTLLPSLFTKYRPRNGSGASADQPPPPAPPAPPAPEPVVTPVTPAPAPSPTPSPNGVSPA